MKSIARNCANVTTICTMYNSHMKRYKFGSDVLSKRYFDVQWTASLDGSISPQSEEFRAFTAVLSAANIPVGMEEGCVDEALAHLIHTKCSRLVQEFILL